MGMQGICPNSLFGEKWFTSLDCTVFWRKQFCHFFDIDCLGSWSQLNIRLFSRTCISVSASLIDVNFDDVILIQFKDFWGIFSFNPFSIQSKKSEVPEAVTSATRELFK